MDGFVVEEPRARRIELPERGGVMAALEFGPPDRPIDIVFSHANGFNARTYRTILAPLSPPLRILALDLRGHGRTELPTPTEGRTSWDGLAEDLLAVLTTLDVRDAVLSGHSMGGTSSLLAAAQAPERVKALVLFDPVLLPPGSSEAYRRGQAPASAMEIAARRRRAVFESRQEALAAYTGRGAFKSWSPAQLADYVADGFRDRPDGQVELACAPEWEASNFGSHGHDPWPALRAPPCPVRIFRAEQASTSSSLTPHLDELAAAGVRIETVPGTTHFLPMERPDVVRAGLSDI
ncbi:alpha/beta fold hydrolase [Phenylobacterium terrae]|uniref:Alpha/beta fold hydrolase n=1 Tax=Phenylobacterium terrae TaxID=2665495 RepID=A0ABW4N284_9CAUL